MQKWKLIEKKVVLKSNKFLTVEFHKIQLPCGRIIDDWQWLIMPDFVNIIAVDLEGKFLLFKQNKYAVEGEVLAPIGGYLEPGEEPLAGAQRELLEETGYLAEKWFFIGDLVVDANRGCGRGFFYLALDAKPSAKPIKDDLEDQELLFLTKTELEDALDGGRFKIMPWATSIALALRKLEKLKASE